MKNQINAASKSRSPHSTRLSVGGVRGARLLAAFIAVGAFAAPACFAQDAHFDSGSTGADGDLVIADSERRVLNMNAHADGVFNYNSVTIGQYASLEVERNADNTPLVILVKGDFIIGAASQILIQGRNGLGGAGAIQGAGGPGGFDGGVPGVVSPVAAPPGPGLGPGGGAAVQLASPTNTLGGGTNAFMRPSLVPLIGGSGGGGGMEAAAGGSGGGSGGGGGGGAILIAVSGVFNVIPYYSHLVIDASGGDGGGQGGYPGSGGGGGSGGAIRIIAGEIRGTDTLDASGGAGGTAVDSSATGGQEGIIRLETFRLTSNFTYLNGRVFNSLPGLVSADATDLATLRISKVAGVDVPLAAGANIAQPDLILPPGTTNPVRITVEATNVTPGQAATIKINFNGNGGQVISAVTGVLAGTINLSTAFADVSLPAGVGTMAAILTTAPSFPGAGPGGGASASNSLDQKFEAAANAIRKMRLTIDGEPVTEIETAAVIGQSTVEATYKTDSGRTATYKMPN